MNEITVCMLAYNAEKYIEEALASLEQQNADFRYLLIDDGSRDDTLKLMYLFQKSSKHNTDIKHFETNMGTAFCRNWALNNVTTDLMMFFDSDDIAAPNLIEKLRDKLLSDEKHMAVSCYSSYIDEHGKIIGGGQHIGPVTGEEFLLRATQGKLIFMLPITLFYRARALAVGGYRLEGFPDGQLRYQDYSEDLDLWSRMSDLYTEGLIMITIPEVLYYYRKSTKSLSTGKDGQLAMNYKIEYIKHNLKLRRANKPDITFNQFIADMSEEQKRRIENAFYAGYYYRTGAFLILQHRYFSAMRYMMTALIKSPKFMVQKLKASFFR